MPTTIAQHQLTPVLVPVPGGPLSADAVRTTDNTTIGKHNDHDGDPGVHLQSSTLAARPAAGTLGRKWVTADAGSYKLWYDTGTVWAEIGADTIDIAFRADGNVVKGDVLKLTGWNNGLNLPELAPATGATDIAFAIAAENVSNNQRGLAVNTGFVDDVNTGSFSAGDILYPSKLAGPGSITSWFTASKPTSGVYQTAAYVVRSNSTNGVLFVEFSAPRIVESTTDTANTVVLRDGSGNVAVNNITVAGTFTASQLETSAPSVGTAEPWKLGKIQTGSWALDASVAVVVEIDGVQVYLGVVTGSPS
jgi:hypothetical protein